MNPTRPEANRKTPDAGGDMLQAPRTVEVSIGAVKFKMRFEKIDTPDAPFDGVLETGRNVAVLNEELKLA